MVLRPITLSSNRAKGPESLEVEKLIIQNVTIVNILIGPVTGFRNVKQPPVVKLPGPEKKTHLLHSRDHPFQEGIITRRFPVFTTADNKP
jgi:hypothetical protein